jgi:hypothetical protein
MYDLSELFDRFPEMQQIKKAPSLYTINGIGTSVYGQRDFDLETGTYVKTLWFTFLFIPIVPLGAYRVVDVPPGWAFLGKVPVSGVAKGWPVLLLLVGLGIFGGIGLKNHLESPEYAAQQKLAQADGLREDGKLAEAAALYRDVAESGTEHAGRAMQTVADMLSDKALGEPVDAMEVAGVFRAAWDLRRQPQGVADLFDRGMRFAAARAADNPTGSLAVLDAVEPAAPDFKATLPLRQKILERLVQERGDDVELLSKLAVTYERAGQRERCLALLEPHAKHLGTTEGARILGLLYYDNGKHDAALTLLQAYADQRLAAVEEADKQFRTALHSAEDNVISSLKTGHASGFDYARYRRSSQAQQDAQVAEYISEHLRDNAQLARRREEFVRLGVVVPVALDLGMMRLGRAQRMGDPAERKGELERAEKTFLAVRGLAGDQAAYRLSLGQVYYWLGKQAEGRKLFDETLAADNRRYETVMLVARLLRELGAMDEARHLSEEAYGQKGIDDRKRHEAALLRALSPIDHDDALAWLEKSNQSDPEVKAYLAETRGHKAMTEGREDAAAAAFRDAIAVYAAQPESAATLNNGAIAYLGLLRASGELSALDRALAMQQKATELKPGDGILVGNVASLLLSKAAAELAGGRIDYPTLRLQPEVADFDYLYADAAGRAALAQRARGHATIVTARTQLDRALILAPNNAMLYMTYARLLTFLDETKPLGDLGRRAAESRPDLGAARQRLVEHWQGKRDAQRKPEASVATARAERIATAARRSGGATFAIAVGQLMRARGAEEVLGMPIDTDALVRQAEEAHRLAPSLAAQNNLRTAHLMRASKMLAAKEPEYAKMVERAGRALGSSYLLAAALWRDGPARKAALASADVQRALTLLRESAEAFPVNVDAWTWVMLRALDANAGDRYAATLKNDLLHKERRELDGRFEVAGDPVSALRRCWLLEATGSPGDPRAILQRCAADGGPLPFDVP